MMKFVHHHILIVVFLALVGLAITTPIPQEAAQDGPSVVDESDYVDAVVTNSDGSKAQDEDDQKKADEPLKVLGGLLKGLFNFLKGSVNVLQGAARSIQTVAEDPEVAETVNGLVKTGSEVAGQAIKMGQQALENAPEVIERSSQFVGGVVKTANETQPILKKNFMQLGKFGKIAGVAIRGVSSVVASNIQSFLGTFDRRLKCHMDCTEKNLSTQAEIAECEAKFCNGFDAESFKFKESEDSSTTEERNEALI